MKISYNWLKNYINTDLSPEQISVILTDIGLEVETLEKVQSIPGGLEGLVIGHVTHRSQHPNADRLSVTKVNVGLDKDLDIVCGASNIAEGQKVIVATVGCTVYPTQGEPFAIKKSKIRGEVSEGMICSEDEIGLGNNHDGIMVLPEDAPIGILAKDYLKIENDFFFEIGLTPNRVDASSHIGVARDIAAALKTNIILPSVADFKVDNNSNIVNVNIQDTDACPRYSGISISNIKVAESPEWLQKSLKAIGLRPINNIVDITNFVLFEIGQPLHAFDISAIKGKNIIVRKANNDAKFITLDNIERKLSSDDLMICNETDEMCIAGVFGGLNSGVTENTTEIFIESAYFNPVTVRKTAKRHGLKTDSSFRFERGTDPNITVFALKRAAMLIKEIAGGVISSEIIDIYPKVIKEAEVELSFNTLTKVIGFEIPTNETKAILKGLDINIVSENNNSLHLRIPTCKVDVTREIDVIEEILRIYGYNNIPTPTKLNSSLSFSIKPNPELIQNTVSDFLSSNGFNEIMSNSLTKSSYAKSIGLENGVVMLNPLSQDLDEMRQTLLFSGLETITHNQNRKNTDLKLYEFGKSYKREENNFIEKNHLALFITGRQTIEQWNTSNQQVDFYLLKGIIDAIILKLNIKVSASEFISDNVFAQGVAYNKGKNNIVTFGLLNKTIQKKMDIDKAVYYADFNWEFVIKSQQNNKATYKELSKFPFVRRDLSMIVDKNVTFSELKNLAEQAERKLLKEINVFDCYQGDKIPDNKKSYALSFILQDEEKTLTDIQIDNVMQKIILSLEKSGAEIRN